MQSTRGASLRIGFAGTPEFAVPALQALLGSEHSVVVVLTQPDRPAGRGRALRQSPAKKLAVAHQIEVRQPLRLTAEDQAWLASYDLDLLVVVAYGMILPPALLKVPRLGCWNIHASLLPRWRGAAPIQRAIEAGDRETGVCLMQMDAGLDTGPVLARLATPIGTTDTAGALHDRLATLGARVLQETLAWGTVPRPHPQAAEGACYAHKISTAEAQLDPQRSAACLERKVRAFSPVPVAWLKLGDTRLRVYQAVYRDGNGEAGEILSMGAHGIDMATPQGVLRLLTVQRPGGKAQPAAAFNNAAHRFGVRPGARFERPTQDA